MIKEDLLECIFKNQTWDAEVLLERLGITWDELIILLKQMSDILEWSLHNYLPHYYLSNGVICHTSNWEFAFRMMYRMDEEK